MPVPMSEEVFHRIFKLNYGEPNYHQSDIWYTGGGKFMSREHGLVGVECLWSNPSSQQVRAPEAFFANAGVPHSVITHTSRVAKTEQESPISSQKKFSANVKNTIEKVAKEIEAICMKGQLSKQIRDRAEKLYETVCAGNQLGGRRAQGMPAACVYIACREEEDPRSPTEVSKFSGQQRSHVVHCVSVVWNRMDTKPKKATATDYIIRFGATLNLPESVKMAAVNISSKANELNLVTGQVFKKT